MSSCTFDIDTFIVFVFVLMTRLANSRLTGMLLITLFGWKNPLYLSTMFCETHLFSPETTRISRARWWRESRPSRTRRGRRGTRACRRGRRGWGGSGSGLARSSDTQLSNEAAPIDLYQDGGYIYLIRIVRLQLSSNQQQKLQLASSKSTWL